MLNHKKLSRRQLVWELYSDYLADGVHPITAFEMAEADAKVFEEMDREDDEDKGLIYGRA